MRFLFRTDASTASGTGHVMRCATLARALLEAGHEIRFLCREIPGNLNRWLEEQGFAVTRLAVPASATLSQPVDAAASRLALDGRSYDWIIVDQYELDAEWERAMAACGARILAIDDLGRPHHCDLLLDQNYRNPAHELYPKRVNRTCRLLLGPDFALVRPDFTRNRPTSLTRQRRALSHVLVFMGGSDAGNQTAKALAGLALAGRPDLTADVVIGATNPHRQRIEAACMKMPNVTLHVQTPRMAELMVKADLAVCAGGTTTWERCVLGLPALVTILADNQAAIAEAMAAAGAQRLLGWHDKISARDYGEALAALDPGEIARMSERAAAICDGGGVARLVRLLAAPEAATRPEVSAIHA
jgi:UDP-2,4-diacetamido-2,4,6-trideoxy-beta-L-altropyranose hydrolase